MSQASSMAGFGIGRLKAVGGTLRTATQQCRSLQERRWERPMAGKVRFEHATAADVNQRLRMFAIVNGLSISNALAVALYQAFPSVDGFSEQLRQSEATS